MKKLVTLLLRRYMQNGSLLGTQCLQKNKFPALRLVLGGANSGKSRVAEHLIVATGRTRRYIATAQAWDDEMRAKIAQQPPATRTRLGPPWRRHWILPRFWRRLSQTKIILLDCVTLWLSNLMMAERDIQSACAALCAGLAQAPCPVYCG